MDAKSETRPEDKIEPKPKLIAYAYYGLYPSPGEARAALIRAGREPKKS